jgi:hypothetical protein
MDNATDQKSTAESLGANINSGFQVGERVLALIDEFEVHHMSTSGFPQVETLFWQLGMLASTNKETFARCIRQAEQCRKFNI